MKQATSLLAISTLQFVIGHIPMPQPYFIHNPLSLAVVENMTVWLPCSVENLGENVIRWWRGRVLLADSSDHSHPRPPRMRMWANNTLEISDLRRDDEAEYVCQIVRQEPWHPLQQKHHIKILFPPEIFTEPADGFIDMKLGETAEMACLTRGAPTPKVTWRAQGQELPEDVETKKPHILTITANSPKIALTYMCTAENGIGEPAVADFKVLVRYKPHVTTESKWVHAGIGYQAELSCKVSAVPEASVQWFHEGLPVQLYATKNDNYFQGEKNILELQNVAEADLGIYTCRATNSEGSTEVSIELSGRAKVAHMKSQQSNQSKNSFELIWEVDSYSPIIEYSLQFREIPVPDDSEWVTVIVPADGRNPGPIHSKSYLLSGLQEAAAYEATVKSRNRYGWSAPTKPFLFATEGGNLPTTLVLSSESTPISEGSEGSNEIDFTNINMNTIAKELSISSTGPALSTAVTLSVFTFLIHLLQRLTLNNTI